MMSCTSRALDLKGKGTRISEVKVCLSLKEESSQEDWSHKLKESQAAWWCRTFSALLNRGLGKIDLYFMVIALTNEAMMCCTD